MLRRRRSGATLPLSRRGVGCVACDPSSPYMKTRTPVALMLLLALPAISFAASEPKIDHYVHLTPENSAIGNFPARKAPILTVKSGAVVKVDTGGGAGWRNAKQDPDAWLKENGVPTTMADNVALRETDVVLQKTPRDACIENGHLLVGPIAIEGAMPGDSLEVRILSVVPRIPFGTTGRTPGRGLRQTDNERPPSKVTILDLKRNVGMFEPGVEVPLGPFMGVMGLLPPASQGPNRRSGPPGSFGGNFDCKELIAGSTLYLPVFNKGALFYTGDAHAAQGDGEVDGAAIEISLTPTFEFHVHKNAGKRMKWPRAEDASHHYVMGMDEDLDIALKEAVREAVEFLEHETGVTA